MSTGGKTMDDRRQKEKLFAHRPSSIVWFFRIWRGMGDMGWSWESPLGHIDRPESRELCPVVPEIIATEQMGWLCPGKQTRAFWESCAGEAIDVVLREPMVAALPGMAAIAAGKDRRPCDKH